MRPDSRERVKCIMDRAPNPLGKSLRALKSAERAAMSLPFQSRIKGSVAIHFLQVGWISPYLLTRTTPASFRRTSSRLRRAVSAYFDVELALID